MPRQSFYEPMKCSAVESVKAFVNEPACRALFDYVPSLLEISTFLRAEVRAAALSSFAVQRVRVWCAEARRSTTWPGFGAGPGFRALGPVAVDRPACGCGCACGCSTTAHAADNIRQAIVWQRAT